MQLCRLLACVSILWSARTHAQLLWDTSDSRLFSTSFGFPGVNASYDYVVVGGGTAGNTIAARLAQIPGTSVAIVEAGGFYEIENSNFSVVPGLALSAPFLATTPDYPPQPLVDWGVTSIPQAGALGRTIHYAQGKTLGGSSALNTMAYHYAANGTYQKWADLVQDDNYTFGELQPFYKSSCTLTPPDSAKRQTPNATVEFNASSFCDDGPLQVSWPNWVDVTLTWFQRAFTNVGLPISSQNFGSGNISGYSAWIPSSVASEKGIRSSSQQSFLNVAPADGSSLTVYTHSQVLKVLFNSTTATGVQAYTGGVKYTIGASKEVIVSGGVLHSPQLLMVSGIGPSAVLKSLNIPVVSDLEGVGQNLWDQPIFGVTYPVNTPTSGQILADPEQAQQALVDYHTNATGPYSSYNGYIAFEKIPQDLRANFTSAASQALEWFPSDWPEVEYLTEGGVAMDGSGAATGSILTALCAPLSRGNVTIKSASALDPPVFNLGWFTDPAGADAQVAVAGIRRNRQAFASIPDLQTGPELAPGPTVQSDNDILEYIKNSTSTLYHAAGTCKMGCRNDTMAVVDSHARVFGVQNLRVVDNSISPFAVPGHPQSTVYMLAEKIANYIRTGA